MIYYKITLFTNKADDGESFPLKGGMKSMKWLKYSGDDGGMKMGEKKEDESLAMQILIENLQELEYTLLGSNDPNEKVGKQWREVKGEDDLKEIISGGYEKVLVEKYESDRVMRR